MISFTSDDAVVLLSNHHVLIDPGGAVGDGVGHPRWRKSCCCTCGKIAEVSAFDEALDCAIAKLDSGVDYAPKIRRIMRSDGTKELEGTIAGSAAPVLNDEVWKVGARTGLTRGTIADIDPTEVEVQPLAAFPRMSNSGDSGSVYVSLATGNVCGLHHSGDGTNAFGSPIDQVEAALGIVVIPTDVAANYPVVDWIELGAPIPVEAPFDGIVEQLTCSPAGQRLLRLFEVHRDECLELVTTCRAFTVAWHRAQGPAYLAALARSARDPDYRIPRVFAGIDRAQAADRLAAVLRAVASDELVADLDEHGHGLRRAIVGGDDIDELIDLWEGSRLLAG